MQQNGGSYHNNTIFGLQKEKSSVSCLYFAFLVDFELRLPGILRPFGPKFRAQTANAIQ